MYILVIAICDMYWACALVAVWLRATSAGFRSLTAYGGRDLESKPYFASWAVSFPVVGQLNISSVSRKFAFCFFYITGVAAGLSVALLTETNTTVLFKHYIPCLLFEIHCLVRLIECFKVHHFRKSLEDRTSTFAWLSGSSFYVAATLSIWVTCRATVALNLSLTFKTGILLNLVLAVVHAVLQVAQAYHHWFLAALRTSHQKASSGQSSRYKFPQGVGLFKYVLEPHYALEFMQYFSFVIFFFVSSLGALSVDRTVKLLVNISPVILVALFTLVNLNETAIMHRKYWVKNNVKVPKYNLLYKIV